MEACSIISIAKIFRRHGLSNGMLNPVSHTTTRWRSIWMCLLRQHTLGVVVQHSVGPILELRATIGSGYV